MARIKPQALLLQSKKKKGPTRISVTTIVLCNLLVVLVVLCLFGTYRHWSRRFSSSIYVFFFGVIPFLQFFFLVSKWVPFVLIFRSLEQDGAGLSNFEVFSYLFLDIDLVLLIVLTKFCLKIVIWRFLSY